MQKIKKVNACEDSLRKVGTFHLHFRYSTAHIRKHRIRKYINLRATTAPNNQAKTKACNPIWVYMKCVIHISALYLEYCKRRVRLPGPLVTLEGVYRLYLQGEVF